jgi:hypothetical protein
MAYAQSAVAPWLHEIPAKIPAQTHRAKRGFFQRMLDAIEAHTMRRAEAQIARYLGPGQKFTDEAAREIERRFLSNR